ncbi:MAG: chromate transporter [Bryobacterales bacterium]|nr:chromate transporter [Bryobacterales bacterium]
MAAVRPSIAALTAIYAKLGNTTFGGGDPTIAALQRELGERRGWLSPEQFALAFSLSRVTPGTNVLAFCAATGYQLCGWMASVSAVLGASAPSAVLAVWLTLGFESAKRNLHTNAAIMAVLAAVTGMMVASAFALARPSLTRQGWPRVLLLSGGTLLLREAWNFSPLQIMAFACAVGALWLEDGAQ